MKIYLKKILFFSLSLLVGCANRADFFYRNVDAPRLADVIHVPIGYGENSPVDTAHYLSNGDNSVVTLSVRDGGYFWTADDDVERKVTILIDGSLEGGRRYKMKDGMLSSVMSIAPPAPHSSSHGCIGQAIDGSLHVLSISDDMLDAEIDLLFTLKSVMGYAGSCSKQEHIKQSLHATRASRVQ